MLKTILPILVSLIVLCAKTQIYNSNCTITPNLLQLYKMDASRLAELRLQEINSPFKDSITLHQPTMDTILQALIRMHNIDWSPLRDTLRNLFQFQDFSSFFGYEPDSTHFNIARSNNYQPTTFAYYGKGVGVQLSNTLGWVGQWRLGNFNNTSNPQINYLINRYNLQVVYRGGNYTFFPYLSNFGIQTNTTINAIALRNELTNIEPTSATFFGYNTSTASYSPDGHRVTIKINSSFIDIDYEHRCGDCPSGCDLSTTWKFRLPFNSCTVEYKGRVGWSFESGRGGCGFRGTLMSMDIQNLYLQSQLNKNILHFTSSKNSEVTAFEIERSSNGIDFNKIGSLPSTTTSSQAYTFVDDIYNNYQSLYYRVRIITPNNGKNYSKIVKAQKQSNSTLTVITIANSNTLQASFFNEDVGKINISIYNNLGVKIWQSQNIMPQGMVQLPISLPNCGKGNYYLQINGAITSKSKAFILQ